MLYADVTVLVAETTEHLQHTVNGFDSMGLKINVGKSKGLVVTKD